ncbi:hypothetical protein PX699_21195 [Sphingobium sp. H39-3-25]|uniref:hypothetical protein n=1 Tax=Sphingobium arseniciresistens TaxID=3030834 RepID=UPI0023B8DB2E|nr:hypothetical protein [Sphingobium arseniciresistens]
MKQIGDVTSTLFVITIEERHRLCQTVALGLVPSPCATKANGSDGAVVQFRSLNEARRVRVFIE